jgi:hypothetical protein
LHRFFLGLQGSGKVLVDELQILLAGDRFAMSIPETSSRAVWLVLASGCLVVARHTRLRFRQGASGLLEKDRPPGLAVVPPRANPADDIARDADQQAYKT